MDIAAFSWDAEERQVWLDCLHETFRDLRCLRHAFADSLRMNPPSNPSSCRPRVGLSRRQWLRDAVASAGVLCLAPGQGQGEAAEAPEMECDVFVYGSTPGGIAAAIQAARGGAKTILACPQKHAGGMAASGLCTTDAVRRQLFGGLVVEFIDGVRQVYRDRLQGESSPEWKLIQDGWYYEPSVAERVFDAMLAKEADHLEFWRGHHLIKASVEGGLVRHVELETPQGDRKKVTARTFIDGTYEGDLAAAAGVAYRVGREGREEFGEPFAGIHYMDWKTGQTIDAPDNGEPSMAIQAFCARIMLTTDPGKMVPLSKPASYDEHLEDLLPLLEDFSSGRIKNRNFGTPLPGKKFNLNGGIEDMTSLNCPGVSWAWPEAARHHRARLAKFHLDHAASFTWFLQNEPRVPDHVRALWKTVGLHQEEFPDNGHWPWQIYVRQGRRIEGRARLTQHSFTVDPKTGRTPRVAHPIAIGEHSFDVHPCHDRRFAIDRWMEGVLWYPKKAFGPAQPGQVPYEAMVPLKVDNLLAPVPLCCTHIAMSVLRMEPLWMTMGQIAGLAAVVAKEKGLHVAQIDPQPLPGMLKIQVDPYGAVIGG